MATDFDQGALVARVQAHSLHGSLHGFNDTAVGWVQVLPGAGKLEQRVDEVGHLVYAGSDLLVKLFALGGSETAVTKKLRIGDDGGQGVAKVMGNRTRHASDGGQLLRF